MNTLWMIQIIRVNTTNQCSVAALNFAIVRGISSLFVGKSRLDCIPTARPRKLLKVRESIVGLLSATILEEFADNLVNFAFFSLPFTDHRLGVFMRSSLICSKAACLVTRGAWVSAWAEFHVAHIRDVSVRVTIFIKLVSPIPLLVLKLGFYSWQNWVVISLLFVQTLQNYAFIELC